MREEFSTEVTVDLRMVGFDIDSIDKVMIKWELDFEMREWGVKDTSIHIPDQTLTITGVKVSGTTLTEEDFEIEIKDAEITADFTWHNGSLSPDNLELEFDTKKNVWVGTLT